MSLFFLLNYFGVNFFAKINTVVTFLKFVVPTITVILLLAAFFDNSHHHGHGRKPVLVGFISGATVLTYIIGPVSAMVFRKTAQDMATPFRVRSLPVVSTLAFIVGSLIIYWTGWSNVWPLIVMEIVGLIIYVGFVMKKQELREHLQKDIKSGIWLVVYLLFMLCMSYLGSFGGQKLIVFPWDNVIVAIFSLLFFIWGVRSGYPTASLALAKELHASSHK